MNYTLRHLLIFLLLLSVSFSSKAQIVINEIMQSNIDCIMVDNDFPDSWLEIYNAGDSPVAISAIALGETKDPKSAVPVDASSTGQIEPHGFLLVYCDKETRTYHMPFRLDSGKSEIYLFLNGEVADLLKYKKMAAPNVAYGRQTDGEDSWGQMIIATPGTSNTGGATSTVLPEPVFSAESLVLNDNIELSVSVPQETELPEDTKVYVTVNGSEPTLQNYAYASQDTVNIGVNETMVVKAKLISSSAVSPRATSHSYIIHPREVTLPVISVSTNAECLNDSTTGIFINFEENWRRPMQFEYFPKGSSTSVINQLSEGRVAGAYSRHYAVKSLILYANKRFGTKRFDFQFWEDKPNVSSEIKSIQLRNGGSDWYSMRMRDGLMQTLFGRSVENLDYQAYQPALYYLNGQFMGTINLRERTNEDFVAANYEGLEDIVLVENTEVKQGDSKWLDEYYDLRNNPQSTYEDYANMIDIENFMNMFILETFASNTDFPHNNQTMWREQTPEGKWRWIIKDVDWNAGANATSGYDYPHLDYMLGTGGFKPMGNSQTFIKLMNFKEFSNAFIDRFAVYLGDFLRPEESTKLLAKFADEIHTEWLVHSTMWKLGGSEERWQKQLGIMRDWYEKRPAFMQQYLGKYFNLGDAIPTKIATDNNAEITVNGIRLTTGSFDGAYYANRPLLIEADDPTLHWRATYEFENQPARIEYMNNGAISSSIPEGCISAAFESFTVLPTAVIDITVNDSKTNNGAFDLMGRKVNPDAKGFVIVNGKKRFNK